MNDLQKFKKMLADETEADLVIREAKRQVYRELQDLAIWNDLQTNVIDAPKTIAYYEREFPILLDNGWGMPIEKAVERYATFREEVVAMARKELGL